MTVTALKAAFAKVGIASPEELDEQLTAIAVRAIARHGINTFATIEEIRHVVGSDLKLMNRLFDLEWHRTAGALIYRTRGKIAGKIDRKEIRTPTERKAAVAVNAIMLADRKLEEQDREDQRIAQARYDAEHKAHLESWQATHVGSLFVGDKPVWEVSAGAARKWLASQRVKWRTVELLIEGVPDDGRPISYYRKPEEVAALFAKAQAEAAK